MRPTILNISDRIFWSVVTLNLPRKVQYKQSNREAETKLSASRWESLFTAPDSSKFHH